jgi:hypothetical protein
MRALTFLLFTQLLCAAEPPAFYRSVARVSWVVEDVDAAVRGWTRFGLSGVEPRGEVTLQVEFRSRPENATVRWTSGWLGGVAVDFIQPLDAAGAYGEFRKRHGSGIFSLMHEAPTLEALNAEVERMRGLGVGVLQRGSYVQNSTTARYVYFDTEPEGKFVLGLVHYQGEAPSGSGPTRISQFAFVAREFAPASAYWEKLGFPAFSITRPQLRGVEYRGKRARYEQELGWQRHGSVPYEWCVPPAGQPSVYTEFLERHGEGVQHLGFNVEDIDKAVAQYGFPVSQSGAWGEEGKKGSGRFAYLDTDGIGGVTVELLWSFR